MKSSQQEKSANRKSKKESKNTTSKKTNSRPKPAALRETATSTVAASPVNDDVVPTPDTKLDAEQPTAAIHIPVDNKVSVAKVLSVFGKLFSSKL